MTISNTQRNIVYTGNGSTVDFDFEFVVPENDELHVYLFDVATEVETELLSSQFDVVFNAENVGGTVTYPNDDPPTPITSAKKIIIQREVPNTQVLAITNQGGFNPEVLEATLDRIVMMVQQLQEVQDRSIVISAASTISDLAELLDTLQGYVNVAGVSATSAQTAETNAETAETNAETAETNAETAASAAAASAALAAMDQLGIAVSDENSLLVAGMAKITFRMPYPMTLTAVRANVNTAPTGSTLIVDINRNGTTVLSTKLSIDAGEKTSQSAATPPVISVSALSDDDEITIDIDQVGSAVAGKGLKVWLKGTRA